MGTYRCFGSAKLSLYKWSDLGDLLDGIVTGKEAVVLFNLRTPRDYLLGNAELCWVQALLVFCCVEAKGLGMIDKERQLLEREPCHTMRATWRRWADCSTAGGGRKGERREGREEKERGERRKKSGEK